MKNDHSTLTQETKFAKLLCGDFPESALLQLNELLGRLDFSVINGDIKYLGGGWYITHSGLIRLAERRHCTGIHTQPVSESCDPSSYRWVFKATVFKSRACKGFTGYGDADPSNVSPLVHGAEMRVAETRAVNRALRKAYGIGIVRSRNSGPLLGQHRQIESRRSSHHSQQTEITVARRYATASVKSFDNIGSIPLW